MGNEANQGALLHPNAAAATQLPVAFARRECQVRDARSSHVSSAIPRNWNFDVESLPMLNIKHEFIEFKKSLAKQSTGKVSSW